MKKTLAILMMIISIMVMLPASALAASKTVKGTNSATYTITTKKKATLAIKCGNGTVAQKYYLKEKPSKTHISTVSSPAIYNVTVNGTRYSVSGSKTINLAANSTYTITVSYSGIPSYIIIPHYGTLFNPPHKWALDGGYYWKSAPKITISVNNSAKIN